MLQGMGAATPPPLMGGTCPRDGQRLLQQQVGSDVVDFCPRCSGVFFDGGELERIEGKSPILMMTRRKPTAATPDCVRCGTKMDPYTWAGRSSGAWPVRLGVEIDHCPSCRAYWVDGGELPRVREVISASGRGQIKIDDVTFGQYMVMLLTSLPIEYNVAPTRRPWATLSLVALNVLVFVLSLAACALDSSPERVSSALGLVPDELGLSTLWMLFSYQFAHGGIIHLVGNVYFLYVFGDNLEDRWGPLVYIPLYLFIGAVAGLAHALLTSTPMIPLVGASGAVSGLLGAYLVTFPRARMGCLFLFIPLRVTVLVYMLVWFGSQALGLLLEQAFALSFPVSVSCHVAGFMLGVGVGLVLRWKGATAEKGG